MWGTDTGGNLKIPKELSCPKDSSYGNSRLQGRISKWKAPRLEQVLCSKNREETSVAIKCNQTDRRSGGRVDIPKGVK